MSNGNGTNGNSDYALYDSPNLSKYIRPGMAILGGLISFIIILITVYYLLSFTPPDVAVVATLIGLSGACAAYPLWYYGIRGQEKNMSTLLQQISGLKYSIPINQAALPSVQVLPALPAGGGATATGGSAAGAAVSGTTGGFVAGSIDQGIPAAAPENVVKKAIEANVASIQNDKNVFDYLRGVWGEKIQRFIQQAADNNLTTPEEIMKMAKEFFGVKLTAAQCQNIQSVLGLPAVVKAMNDTKILDSFEAAQNAGTLGPAMMQALRIAANRYAATDVLDAFYKQVIYAPNAAERSLALQKFGIPKEGADQTQTVGGDIYYKAPNGQYTLFQPADLVGRDRFTRDLLPTT